MSKERLDKILASQNIGSRKEVGKIIKSGRVIINSDVIKLQDYKVDPGVDEIFVDNKKIEFKRYIYIMMNKPKGIISASNDKSQKTVIDLLPDKLKRRGLFPAGRLDKDTTGLLIITDDGDFAHRMLSPKKRIYKIYEAKLSSKIGSREINLFKTGVRLDDETVCLPAELKILTHCDEPIVEVKICEGKFHQIKRMFKSVGTNVISLKRKQIGSLVLDKDLEEGCSRELSENEIKNIFK